MENTHKHGGFKWQVDWDAPRGCELGFEGGRVAVDAYAIQYHALGMKSIEFETSQHSTAALLRQCKQDNPVDKGYFFVVQLQEYGQRVAPYQGTVLQYPNSPQPPYRGGFGPYFTTPCVGTGLPFCLPGISHIIDRNRNLNSIWTSKPTGSGTRPQTSRLFRLLFRTRDDYEVLDSSDLTHPFTWLKVCAGPDVILEHCRYNSSTSTIHEIAGNIPGTWDGLAGFDQDPRPGRITAEGFVNRFGFLDRACAAPGGNCYPIKMEGAFVGYYSTQLSINKVGNPTPGNTPERDIYFCHGVPCRETSPGAVPSGWIGEMN
jgi:hypothetical protein